MRTRFQSLLLICLAALLLGLSGGVWAQPIKVRIQGPPAAGLLPLLWLEESGALAEQAELEFFISQDHQRGISLVATGNVDFLVTGVNVGAKAYSKGLDLRLVNTNTWGIDYLLTRGFQAASWLDLEGKSLCLPLQGGPLDFLARYFLQKSGADLDLVDFVYLPSNNGARTFQLGRLDAIILPEPLVTITLNSYPEAVLSLDIQAEWGKVHGGEERIPFVGLFVRGAFAREHPELTALIGEGYRAGAVWVSEHPHEAAALAAKYFGQPAEVVEESLGRIHLQVYPQEEARGLIELFFGEILELYPEMIGGELPDDHFYF
ncbi:MAG TPA: ABC transporter substrate-binding protein [Limnochordia bacterium]|nr:ABC transporter substrate-binding protein [Limnochordia bacterium]